MTLNEFYDKLVWHDWFYEMAEGPAYYAGRNSHSDIILEMQKGGEEYRELYQKFREHKFNQGPVPPRPE